MFHFRAQIFQHGPGNPRKFKVFLLWLLELIIPYYLYNVTEILLQKGISALQPTQGMLAPGVPHQLQVHPLRRKEVAQFVRDSLQEKALELRRLLFVPFIAPQQLKEDVGDHEDQDQLPEQELGDEEGELVIGGAPVLERGEVVQAHHHDVQQEKPQEEDQGVAEDHPALAAQARERIPLAEERLAGHGINSWSSASSILVCF